MNGVSFVKLDMASIGVAGLSSHQSGPARASVVMNGAATALGMSAPDLRTALQGGQSLTSIASTRGVTQDALITAMANSIEQANPSMPADRATKIATDIATRTPPGKGNQPPDPNGQAGAVGGPAATHGHHRHHRHHAVSAAMDAAAKLLGTTASDLDTSLKGGQSLASIATSKGVSQNDLIGAMSTALQGADSLISADQATRLATRLVNGTSDGSQTQPWATGSAGNSSTLSVSA